MDHLNAVIGLFKLTCNMVLSTPSEFSCDESLQHLHELAYYWMNWLNTLKHIHSLTVSLKYGFTQAFSFHVENYC